MLTTAIQPTPGVELVNAVLRAVTETPIAANALVAKFRQRFGEDSSQWTDGQLQIAIDQFDRITDSDDN